ncbi:hypothetical protein J2128_001627 [Methanomicrobium sp. W14]|uniref:hypothetical protein n=1 Tax=Methanomicrobium sp. W14 TaxID=2817839 RepID=UPI001AE965C4|nr:hypothetical protein [Methanomicrobium sp. W14]MBP2133673.1 hypothetical protein [Methanomicrobium sp. W14]
MKKAVIFVLMVISLSFFIAGPVSALEDSEVIMSSDSIWIVAGGSSADITVSLTNSSCQISNVDFSCTNSDVYGDVSLNSATSSPFSTTFSSTKSGTAYIQAKISYTDANGTAGEITKTIAQEIDHAEPDRILNVSYSNEVTVNEVTLVIIRMADEYGNLIDSRYEDDLGLTPESVDMYCSPSDSYFYDGSDYTLNYAVAYVNSTGAAAINYRVSKTPGDNIFTFYPPNDIKYQSRTIEGVSNGEPFSIVAGVNPNNDEVPYLPADGESKFYITYYLEDEFGNPAGNRTVHISSSNINDEPFDRTSNSNGEVMISYGPSSVKGLVTLSAYSVDNESVSVDTRLMFDSTDPVDMLLTANPEVMPSHEVATEKTSSIRAKVIDEKGNPVRGEVVSFFIKSGSYPDYQTEGPSLSSDSAETDEDGQAIVYFTPGSFIKDTNSPLYNALGSANCTVGAKWNTTERDVKVEWKNYPYLSVETSVSNETVEVNKTVDVTVTLKGDGWALQPDPIDVMLSADRSGSMLEDYPDRMVDVMDAMKEFNSAMSEGRDRVGLTTFGTKGIANILGYYYYYWAGIDNIRSDDLSYIAENYPGNNRYYSDYATLDLSLTTDHSKVEDEIDNIVPLSGTPMRKSIYLAIKELVDNPNSNSKAVRAVVVLSDGDYNYYGDPLARGYGSTSRADSFGDLTHNYYRFTDIPSSRQDMTEYASANNITIYSIAFGSGLSSDGVYTLEQLAERTGGTYYAANSANINDVYREIAGDLKRDAGVNTVMDLDFSNVEINNVTVSNSPDNPALSYVYAYDESTVIGKVNSTAIVIPRYTEDDTDDWNSDRALNFDVGTIRLNETWSTTFRLKVLKGGNINLFGPDSTITFNNGSDSLSLPRTYVTAIYNLSSIGINFKDLKVSNLHVTNTGEITKVLNLEWTLYYSGEYSAEQELYYLREGDDVWIPFETMGSVQGPLVSNKTEDASLVVSDLVPGYYTIRVHAKSADTADSTAELDHPVLIGNSSASYIRIE